ncbi:MAG: beta-ketoacyl synthase N-terminal-like domain-containing protein [Oligoflexales bacterium]
MNQDISSQIAIVGIDAIFPDSIDACGFWKDILQGQAAHSSLSDEHLFSEEKNNWNSLADKNKVSLEFGQVFSPKKSLQGILTSENRDLFENLQNLALTVAQRVLEDCYGPKIKGCDRSKISLILGFTSAREFFEQVISKLQRPIWEHSLSRAGITAEQSTKACDLISSYYTAWQENSIPEFIGNVLVGQITERLNLKASQCVVDTANDSSLAAIFMAVQELRLNSSDLVICGGINTMNEIMQMSSLNPAAKLSEGRGSYPTIDDNFDLTHEKGLGMFAFKRLADAQKDEDAIYGVIKGLGFTSKSENKKASGILFQTYHDALRNAHREAGYEPSSVGLLEIQRVSENAGEKTEFHALLQAYSECSEQGTLPYYTLGSVLPYQGGAYTSGVAGFFKVLMSLHHQVLPPCHHLGSDSAFTVHKDGFYSKLKARPWFINNFHEKRRASISSFSNEGDNYYLTMEEYGSSLGNQNNLLRSWPCELLVWGARNDDLLIEELNACLAELKEMDEQGLTWFAYESQEAFDPSNASRIAIVAKDLNELSEKLRKAIKGLISGSAEDTGCQGLRLGHGHQDHKIGLLFSGQGSQYCEMGRELAIYLPKLFASWQDQLACLPEAYSEQLIGKIFPKVFSDLSSDEESLCAENLRDSKWSQAAIASLSLAMMDFLRSLGVSAHAAGGHSLGELMALYAGGSLDAKAVMHIAESRGLFMSELAAGGTGAMLAVFAPEEAIKICLEGLVLQDCYFASYNAPKCQVMAGSKEAMVILEQELHKKGIVSKFLAVGAGFHSSMLTDLVPAFEESLKSITFSPLKMKVYSGRFASPYPKDPIEIPTLLASQLAHPIRFQSMVEAMNQEGCNIFLEIGPKQSLSKLLDKILVGRPFTACAIDSSPSESGLAKFLDLVGLLLSKGVKINTEVLWEAYRIPNKPEMSKKGEIIANEVNTKAAEVIEKPIYKDSVSPEKPQSKPSIDQSVAKEKIMPKQEEPVEESSVQASDFLEAFKEVQKQTADAHEAFQKSMSEAHLAYLKSAEESFRGLASLLQTREQPVTQTLNSDKLGGSADSFELQFNTDSNVPIREQESEIQDSSSNETHLNHQGNALEASLFEDLPIPPVRRGGVVKMGQSAEKFSEFQVELPEDLAQEMIPGSEFQLKLKQDDKGSIIQGASKSDVKTPIEVKTTAMQAVKAEIFSDISEKTGYPFAMLDLNLDLENDLGIDPGKKIDILSSLSDKLILKSGMSLEKINQVKNLRDVLYLWSAKKISENKADTKAVELESEKKKFQNQGFESYLLKDEKCSEGVLEDKPGSLPSVFFKHVLTMIPVQASGLAQLGLWWPKNKYKVLVSESGTSLSWIFCDLLKSKGINAVLGKSVPEDTRAVIFLGGLRPATSPDEAISVNEECFALAKDAATVYGGETGAFITVQDTGGRFGFEAHDPIRCYLSGLPGISKSLQQQQAAWSVKSIDINQGMSSYQEIAKFLFDELAFGGSQLEVGLQANKVREVLTAQPVSQKHGKSLLETGDLVLAVLGSCGITSQAISSFISGCKVKLVLIGRSKLQADPTWATGVKEVQLLREAAINDALGEGRKLAPLEASRAAKEIVEAREVRENISKWQEQGQEVHYLCCEGRDWKTISNHLEQIREKWGPIKGLIYGGGLMLDSILPDNSLDELRRVFDSKVKSFVNLLELTKDDPFKFLSVFTFADSHFQFTGLADHAMANEVLNKIALKESRKRGPSCLVKVILWEPWDESIGTDTMSLHEGSRTKQIPLYQRARWFRNEMSMEEETGVQLILGLNHSSSIPVEELGMNLYLDSESHPFLKSYMIDGKIVVPLVMVIEWFHRLIEPLQKDYQFYNLDKLKVHRGIILENFSTIGDCFIVKAKCVEKTDALILFESQVCSLEGEVLYSAQIEMTKEGLEFPKTLDLSGFVKQDIDAKPGYGDVLFHGPDFQVLQAVGQVEKEGVQAKGAEQEDSHWESDQWSTNAAAYDGGLQLALLWSSHVLGVSSLPMEISKVRSFVRVPKKGSFRCVLKRRSVDAGQACSDMYFLDQSDQLFAKFEGVSTFRNEGA